MFTDLVGYTALTQSNEGQALGLLERHNSLVRPLFPKFHGVEIKSIGDSFLVEFDSALDALLCAMAIQTSLHDYNASSPDDWKIRLRIGIHLGDVVHRDGDVFGDAVNISSRVEPLAEPEGVCISRQVYDQVQNKFEFPLVSLGQKDLKNVKASVEVFAVQMPWATRQSVPSSSGSRRVAVLPFSNLSPDPNDEYFADGLTEELITTVSRIEGTEVISRTSVMQYKKAPKPIREISRELEAGTVLEGSVRKAGNRLRVTVQMVDAGRDRHVWAETYDRNLDDVFTIQTDIAERVAVAFRAKMNEPSGSEGSTGNVDAYTAYLRGVQRSYENDPAALKESIGFLKSAVSMDPSFARAYARLSHVWRDLAFYQDYLGSLKEAEAAAEKALSVGPNTAEAHAAMAGVHLAFDRFPGARKELEVAVRVNPNYAEAYHLLGEVYGAFGELDLSIANFGKAYTLDPLSRRMGIIFAFMLSLAGRTDEAMKVLARLRELYPSDSQVYHAMAFCYECSKDFTKAHQALDEGQKLGSYEPALKIERGVLYAMQGRRDEAEEALRNILATEKGDAVITNAKFWIRNALGDYDEAFEALDEQARLHSWIFFLKSDPWLAELRRDPRFAEFCRKVGLPPD
jgi:TolB-like protein/tetratricopeptide (TPR) repeat protein